MCGVARPLKCSNMGREITCPACISAFAEKIRTQLTHGLGGPGKGALCGIDLNGALLTFNNRKVNCPRCMTLLVVA